jgi:hypothetical protein
MGRKFMAFTTQGNVTAFYDSVDSPPPQDASVIEISDECWLDLINAQAAGKRLAVDDARNPVVLDPLPLTQSEIAFAKRVDRDSVLDKTDWLVARHQDENLLDRGTTLTTAQFTTLLNYRQALRECSDLPNWPDITLPTPPPFLSNQEDAMK